MRPRTPKPLRKFLRRFCTPEQLAEIANSDWGHGADAILAEFRHNLETGEYTWCGDGNPYACCELQLLSGSDPLDALFAAWWIGTFLSGSENDWILIDNLGVIEGGSMTILRAAVQACADLDHAAAAHATVSFVLWLKSRDPHHDLQRYTNAVRALEAIEKLGQHAKESGRYHEFMGTER